MINLQGIIDIGTNTVKLLVIRETEDGHPVFVNKRIFPTKTGKGSFSQNQITAEAAERTIEAIRKSLIVARGYECNDIKAFATAALRNAVNPEIITVPVKNETGIDIEIITGDREAELIYKGVKNAVNIENERYLIMDIGGGSTEYIIADNNRIYFKKSYPHGVSALVEKFEISEKIKPIDQENIVFYLNETTHDLQNALSKYPCSHFVGSSGSFNTFYTVISAIIDGNDKAVEKNTYYTFGEPFRETLQKLIDSNAGERYLTPGIPEMRVETIHMAALLAQIMIEKAKPEKISYSFYSLVEGVWFDR